MTLSHDHDAGKVLHPALPGDQSAGNVLRLALSQDDSAGKVLQRAGGTSAARDLYLGGGRNCRDRERLHASRSPSSTMSARTRLATWRSSSSPGL